MKKNIFDQYAKEICKKYNIQVDELFSPSTKRNISDARQLLYYLCYSRPMRMTEIARYVEEEGLPVTSQNVNYGVKRVVKKIKEDQDYQYVINNIRSCVTH